MARKASPSEILPDNFLVASWSVPETNRGCASPWADIGRLMDGCRSRGVSQTISNRTGYQGWARRTGQIITTLPSFHLIFSRHFGIMEKGGNTYPIKSPPPVYRKSVYGHCLRLRPPRDVPRQLGIPERSKKIDIHRPDLFKLRKTFRFYNQSRDSASASIFMAPARWTASMDSCRCSQNSVINLAIEVSSADLEPPLLLM